MSRRSYIGLSYRTRPFINGERMVEEYDDAPEPSFSSMKVGSVNTYQTSRVGAPTTQHDARLSSNAGGPMTDSMPKHSTLLIAALAVGALLIFR